MLKLKWLLLLLIPLLSRAEEPDLDAIRKLTDQLPSAEINKIDEVEFRRARQDRRFKPPVQNVKFSEIQNSGTSMAALKAGVPLVRIEDNKLFKVEEMIYLRFYKLRDEQGFAYLVNKDGSCTFKIDGDYLSSIKEELAMHEPPRIYTPAPANIVRNEFDETFRYLPEAAFYTGFIQGDYMQDLFNDPKARRGITNQFALNVFGDWNLPVKAGLVFHFDRASYELTGGGAIQYSSLSFGPQFRSKNFETAGHVWRLQTQFRYGPWAQAMGQTINGDVEFRFASSNFLTSVEHPIKNGWGEFVLGLFFQAEWLTIKEQQEIVKVRASNEVNKAWGLSFSQVFQ